MVFLVEKYVRCLDNEKAVIYMNRLNENFNDLNTKDNYYEYIKFIDETGVVLNEYKRFK